MTPEQKVPTLETCKRLKDAGFPQKSQYWWQATYSRLPAMSGMSCYENCENGDCDHPIAWHVACYCEENERFDVAAPDVSELLDVLPKGGIQLFHGVAGGKYVAINELNEQRSSTSPERWTDNPTEALALLWLELNKD